MKHFIFAATLVVLLFAAAFAASAQIKYVGGNILIGNTQPYSYFTITSATNGIYFKHSNNRFLQLDVTPTGAPRIAGHSNQIVFYNSATSTFNAIRVSKVLTYSDARAKVGVKTLTNGMDIIKRLRPVSYNFGGNEFRKASANQYTGSNAEIGLIAQELETVLPNLVVTDEEGHKLVDYVALIPVLIDAVKTLQEEVDMLKSQL